jgi:drug/metabolite transporter (DMT)-like permease
VNAFGPIAAFLSSVTWALGSSAYSKISREHSAFSINFSRALIALPFFLVAALIELGFPGFFSAFAHLNFPRLGWYACSIMASYAFGDTLFLWSTRSLGVPGALAISSVFPIWTALGAYLIHGEPLNGFQSAGLVATVGGVILVIINEPRTHGKVGSVAPTTRGVLLAIACSFFWALNAYSVSEAGRGMSSFVGNTIRMLFALPFCCLMSAAFGVRGRLVLPARVLRASLWVFVLEAFGGSYFFVYGLSHSPMAIASTLTGLAPVLSVPVALALKIERFSVGRTLGICITVIGLCLLVGAG